MGKGVRRKGQSRRSRLKAALPLRGTELTIFLVSFPLRKYNAALPRVARVVDSYTPSGRSLPSEARVKTYEQYIHIFERVELSRKAADRRGYTCGRAGRFV